MAAGFWTNERIEILRQEWQGCSATEIADMLGGGCTKNMVIGKAHRLMLPPKDSGAAVKRTWARLSPEQRRIWSHNIHTSVARNRKAKFALASNISGNGT